MDVARSSGEVFTTEGESLALDIKRSVYNCGSAVTRFELEGDIGHLRGELSSGDDTYRIENLTVDPNYMGIGIAQGLLDRALEDATERGASRIVGTFLHPYHISAARRVFGDIALQVISDESEATRLNYALNRQ